MIYAYLRVSTEKQTLENQRFEVCRWAEERNITIDECRVEFRLDIVNLAL